MVLHKNITIGLFSGAAFFLAPCFVLAAVSFQGGWESGQVTGSGGWSSIQKVGSHSYNLVTDVVRNGTYAARVEVRPGDNPLNCCAGSSRSEVLHLTRPDGTLMYETPSSGTKYFGFSVRLASNFQLPEWSVLFQLHGPDSLNTNPSIAIDLLDEAFVLANRGGNVTASGSTNQHYTISPVVRGKWVDFIVKIRFAGDTRGAVTVWQRTEGESTFTQKLDLPSLATLQHNGGTIGNHYWKFGYYRKDASFTNVLWNDGFVRADTFDEVVNSFSAPSAPSTPPASADTISPSTPTNLKAIAASYSSIKLSWTASTDNVGVKNYVIYQNGAEVGYTAGTTYTKSDLKGGTTYTYRVAARDAAGNSSALSASANATTPVELYDKTILAKDFDTKTIGYKVSDGSWFMPKEGSISHTVSLPRAGSYKFSVTARGTKDNDNWSRMKFNIDGADKDTVTVKSSTFEQYPLTVYLPAGSHKLKLFFVNDGEANGFNRDLYIDRVRIRELSTTSFLADLSLAFVQRISVAGFPITMLAAAAAQMFGTLNVTSE